MNWVKNKYNNSYNIFHIIKIIALLKQGFTTCSIAIIMKRDKQYILCIIRCFNDKQINKFFNVEKLLKSTYIRSKYINDSFFRKYNY